MTKIDHKISIPGYRIIRKIGEGGMSVVYLAHQESLKRDVALKVMRPIITDEENVVRRFEQEAEIIAKLYHPNIVNIYEVGHVDDEVLFYSMPYLQHGDLTTFAYQNDDELKVMLAGICDGLSYAHTQGVVHRDIKPENILFDQFGNVQIADFGIALSTGRRRFTKDSRIVGSVYYMSPEQAQSKHVDARSDIYGLGAILYEILTGDPVFDEDSDLSLMMAHVSNPIPQLPEELSHWQFIIDRCLAKSPNQRFQNMESLKQAVLSIGAKPPVATWKLKMAAFTAVALLTVLGTWYWHTIRQEPETKLLPKTQTTVTKELDDAEVIDSELEQMPAVSDEQAPTELVVDETPIKPAKINQLSAEEVAQLLKNAKRNIAKKQLTIPADENALDQVLKLLDNIPDHAEGLGLLSEVMASYYDLLYQAVNKNDLIQAQQFADSVSEVRHKTILVDESLLAQLEQNTELERSLLLGAVVEKVNAAKRSINLEKAQQLIALVDQVVPGQDLVNELLGSIETVLKTGRILNDAGYIKSVVIAPQINSKKGLVSYGLAVSQSEITWAQYDSYVRATNQSLKRCKSHTSSNLIFSQRNYTKPGFKVSKHMPVVCVTWQQASEYAQWLSEQTGHHYRLPTAREWRHVYRMSEQKVSCGSANLAGQEFPLKEADKRSDYRTDRRQDNRDDKQQDQNAEKSLYNCDDGTVYVATIDRFKKNKLGIIGLAGNVSEWLSGCEKLGKFKAIFNKDDLCDSNPIIGRSWLSGPDHDGGIQSIDFDDAWTHIGFRLIRDLRKE
ncbi:MAG: protein kinase domain-containing protein [Marinicella sp.]